MNLKQLLKNLVRPIWNWLLTNMYAPDKSDHSVTGYSLCERQLTVNQVFDTVVEFYKNECGINPEWSVEANLENLRAKANMPKLTGGRVVTSTAAALINDTDTTRSRRLLM